MMFSERFRALYQDPMSAIRELGVTEGQRVADVGAGKGYFTMAAASIAGPSGFVFAVEPDSVRSQVIQERVTSEGIQNVRVLTTTAENLSEIPSGNLDLAFAAFSFHHFNGKMAGLAEIRRTLREGGVFYLWDRVPGTLIRHGTRPEELEQLKAGFKAMEALRGGRSLRAKFTK